MRFDLPSATRNPISLIGAAIDLRLPRTRTVIFAVALLTCVNILIVSLAAYGTPAAAGWSRSCHLDGGQSTALHPFALQVFVSGTTSALSKA